MNLLSEFRKVRAFVFDIDGVLTDGSILVFENGEQVRQMNVKDGYALQLAIRQNYVVIVVSGGHGTGAKVRLNKLGLTHVYLDVKDKTEALNQLFSGLGIRWEDILYMGDDVPDLAPMKKAGLSAAPADAAAEIQQVARYISPFGGGKGCVRDVIQKVLQLNDHWDISAGLASL